MVLLLRQRLRLLVTAVAHRMGGLRLLQMMRWLVVLLLLLLLLLMIE